MTCRAAFRAASVKNCSACEGAEQLRIEVPDAEVRAWVLEDLEMTRARSLGALILVAGSIAVGCSDDLTGDFYTPPDPLPSDVPGTLIRAEMMEPFAADTQAWRILYVSTAVDGTPIAVSGIVVAPGGSPPEGGRDVVSWAHGLTGLSDRCAPSRGYAIDQFSDLAPGALATGQVLVGTDYEGLGTPGVHPYLVGPSEGRGVLDIVRAAQQIEAAGAGSRVVIWGLSQGGHAAAFAGEIAPSWAPELEVLGVVTAAPGSELQTAVRTGALFPATRYIQWYLGVAFAATYDDLSIADIFSAATLDAIQGALEDEVCLEGIREIADGLTEPIFTTNPLDLEYWPERLLESSPGYSRTEAPMLILQSQDDTDVPILLTNTYYNRLCEIGSEVDYRTFEGIAHGDTFVANLPLVAEWTAARFAGEPSQSTCD
jgi:acetyl esterase/lipase